jgi:mRNA-degrading endonuclease RelE of RelBE toxin-antitoxin system
MNTWRVTAKKKIERSLNKLPKRIREAYAALIFDLSIKGPCPGKKWQNYSTLGPHKHHCHLTYSYVACWEEVSGEIRVLEVYYVGSREKAPY